MSEIEIKDEDLYCSMCEQMLGIEYNSPELWRESYYFVCCNPECFKFEGGYFTKDRERRIAIGNKLKSLGAKIKITDISKEGNPVIEDWH
jgi:hypothetical protein